MKSSKAETILETSDLLLTISYKQLRTLVLGVSQMNKLEHNQNTGLIGDARDIATLLCNEGLGQLAPVAIKQIRRILE